MVELNPFNNESEGEQQNKQDAEAGSDAPQQDGESGVDESTSEMEQESTDENSGGLNLGGAPESVAEKTKDVAESAKSTFEESGPETGEQEAEADADAEESEESEDGGPSLLVVGLIVAAILWLFREDGGNSGPPGV